MQGLKEEVVGGVGGVVSYCPPAHTSGLGTVLYSHRVLDQIWEMDVAGLIT